MYSIYLPAWLASVQRIIFMIILYCFPVPR